MKNLNTSEVAEIELIYKPAISEKPVIKSCTIWLTINN